MQVQAVKRHGHPRFRVIRGGQGSKKREERRSTKQIEQQQMAWLLYITCNVEHALEVNASHISPRKRRLVERTMSSVRYTETLLRELLHGMHE